MMFKERTGFLFILLFICFTAIGVRLFFIQVWNHDKFNDRVMKMVNRERPGLPCRGKIFDKNGRILAMSIKDYALFVDPKIIDDASVIINKLKEYNPQIEEKLNASIGKTSYLPLASNLDASAVKKIKSMNLRGVGFHEGYRREYPEGKMACHLIGIAGKTGEGLEGVELYANKYLSGEVINELKMRDGKGREIAEKMIDPGSMKGADVYLTLDANLQFIAEQEIDAAWKQSKSKKAIAIIQDPNTGEILAMASRPAFSPGNFDGNCNVLRNPAISDIFEPGSTFKIVTAAATLEEKVVKPEELIWCENGKYNIFRHTINDHEKKGFLTFNQVIEHSSNIGVAKIAQRLGKEKLYKFIRQFGFYSSTGIDLPGEAKGLLKDPDVWSGLSLPVISFGQEIGVTAIQIINAYSAIANNGELLAPRIIKEVKNASGEKLFVSEKQVIRKVISSEVADKIKYMLSGVVERGTGQMAKVPGYSVGGKTGTAQKCDPKTGRYSKSSYITSFCGVIPISSPRFTILVILDEPKGDYYASTIAAPVFSRIASRAVVHAKVPPDSFSLNLAGISKHENN